MDYKDLFKKIKPILDDYRLKKKERQEKGEEFNIFRTMRMQFDEVHTHSAVLSALLNPKELHGCKSSFLKAFLNQIDVLKEYATEIDEKATDAEIEIEKFIGNISKNKEEGGRLDILIKFKTKDGKVLIIIENKIYANDEEMQLVRYCNYAKNEEETHSYIPYIFYLTLFGSPPSSNSTDNRLKCGEDYYCISYHDDILKWLNVCEDTAIGKPLVHGIITQYKDLVETLTNQNMDTTTRNKIAEEISSSYENIIEALAINDCFNQIQYKMCEKELMPIFDEVAKYHDLKYERYGQWGNKYGGVSFKKENWETLSIGFEFMKDNLDDFCYGIKYQGIKEDYQKEKNQKALDFINEDNELGAGLKGNYWPWYIRDNQYPNWMQEEAIKALFDGSIKKHVESIITRYIDKINSIECALNPKKED